MSAPPPPAPETRTAEQPAMKRKKWTEEEEETLIDKYGELLRSGYLSKPKTSREKRLQPIADHLNAAHHNRRPTTYPFRWTWRDVCVKVHNMRHQYLGVKHKIQLPQDLLPSSSSPATLYAWSDGDLHWPNFLKYKAVFGDHDLDALVFPDDDDEEAEFGDGEEEWEGHLGKLRKRKGAAFTGFNRLEGEKEEEIGRESWRRMEAEERREEEEMEWRLRMLGMQMEHEKQVMEALAESCHNQLQILGVLVRMVCQFFGNGGGDGMGGGGLVGDGGKSDPSSGSHFM